MSWRWVRWYWCYGRGRLSSSLFVVVLHLVFCCSVSRLWKNLECSLIPDVGSPLKNGTHSTDAHDTHLHASLIRLLFFPPSLLTFVFSMFKSVLWLSFTVRLASLFHGCHHLSVTPSPPSCLCCISPSWAFSNSTYLCFCINVGICCKASCSCLRMYAFMNFT